VIRKELVGVLLVGIFHARTGEPLGNENRRFGHAAVQDREGVMAKLALHESLRHR